MLAPSSQASASSYPDPIDNPNSGLEYSRCRSWLACELLTLGGYL